MDALTDIGAPYAIDVARLSAYLAGRLDGFAPPLRLKRFAGGRSNPTYLLETETRLWVLRKRPPGALLPSAHQVGREFMLLRALARSGVPVPATHLYCEDATVIGSEFFLMDYVPGRVFEEPSALTLTPRKRTELYADLMSNLARLHSLKAAQLKLDPSFFRPGNYYERQLKRWSSQYLASRTDDMPDIDRLMQWLPNNIPAHESSLVHGDYSLRNCIVHESAPRIAAVLDWELAAIGDPLSDVAYAVMFQYDGEAPAPGVPHPEQLFEIYFTARGLPPIADWRFYLAFVFFRRAAIGQGVYKRSLEGLGSEEVRQTGPQRIRHSAARGWGIVEGLI